MKRIAFVLAILLLAIGTFVLSDFINQKNSKPVHAAIYPNSQTLPDFNLTDSNNQPFNKKRLQGQWSLVFFGYTRCPDVCPTELYMLANALKKIKIKNAKLPQVVFVSLDPKRDSANVLKKYTEHFHPNFIGVTGAQSKIDILAKKMGVIHEKTYEKNGQYVVIENNNIPSEVQDSYLVNHSARIQIISPKGEIFGVFMNPHDADKIASDMIKIQQNG